ncbi:MAG: hypothetical protein ACYS0G_07365 [Planctomycetota bacterium]|jgi:hypothetical protein
MLAQDPRGREPLVTFRLGQRIDALAEGQRLKARRIADHRPRYLGYEGPLSEDRGSVRRLARGTVVADHRQPDTWRLELLWDVPSGGARRQWLHLDRTGPQDWVIEATDAQRSKPRRRYRRRADSSDRA